MSLTPELPELSPSPTARNRPENRVSCCSNPFVQKLVEVEGQRALVRNRDGFKDEAELSSFISFFPTGQSQLLSPGPNLGLLD